MYVRRPPDAQESALTPQCSVVDEGFTCCVCLDILVNPVTLQCGHSTCQLCFVKHLEALDQQETTAGNATCPLGRCIIPFIVPSINHTLCDIIEASHAEQVAERKSEGDGLEAEGLRGRIRYLHARAAACGLMSLSPSDRRVGPMDGVATDVRSELLKNSSFATSPS